MQISLVSVFCSSAGPVGCVQEDLGQPGKRVVLVAWVEHSDLGAVYRETIFLPSGGQYRGNGGVIIKDKRAAWLKQPGSDS